MITTDESGLLAGIRSDEAWSLVEHFSRTRRELPDEYENGAAHLVDRLESAGLPVTLHRPSIYLGIPRSASVICEGRSLVSKATALSPSQAPLTAPLVHVAALDKASRIHTSDPMALFGLSHRELGARVAGKIVLTEGLSNPGRSELFQGLGALAAITINPGSAVHWGASSVVWGSPELGDLARLPRIPSLAVNQESGAWLMAAAARGAAVTVAAEVLHGWFEQSLPVVEIAGERSPSTNTRDEFVLLHGHLDSWDLGVGDNATGNAVLLEVARALHAQRHLLSRSVRIAWWPGHSAGRYAGSSWYADQFAFALREQCVAHLNCDSPGCQDATDYSAIRGMAEAEPLVAGAVADLFGQATRLDRPGRAGDYSFNNLGISGALLTSSMVPPEERQRRGWYAVGGNGGSPTWHTEDDVLAVASRPVLENDIRLYALVVARLTMGDSPWLDYRRAVHSIGRRVHAAAAIQGCPVDLRAHCALTQRLEGAVQRCYDDASGRPRDGASWRRLLASSRSMVRAGYAEGGVYHQDAAYAQPAVPTLMAAELAATDPSARVSLQRSANQLRAELEAALAALDG